MMPTRPLVLMLSLGLAVAAVANNPVSPPNPMLWGPPVMCHPIAFASGESLPFGIGRFDAEEGIDRATVLELVIGKIAGSDDTFFHMETLRRGMVYLAWGDDPLKPEIECLVKSLEGRVDLAQQALESAPEIELPNARRALGLAAFDLAWVLEGLGELRLNPRTSKVQEAALERALTHRGDDDAIQLGAAILGFARQDDAALYQHLGMALREVEDESGLLARNADNTIGLMTGVRGARALATLCEQKSKRS